MPTQSYVLDTSWQLVGDAPCTIENQSTTTAQIYVGPTVPGAGAGYATLRSDDMDGFPVRGTGNRAWARVAAGSARIAVSPSAEAGGSAAPSKPPLTYASADGFPRALTASWVKAVTTTASTKGLRISPVASASAYDIEWVAVAPGAAAPTDAFGEPIQGGEDFAAGLPIGDIYLRSASLQTAVVRVGA